MAIGNHDDIVDRQFGPQASAYLSSTVHASGEDLQQMVALVGNHAEAIALDMGCGAGHVAFHLAPKVAKIVAYDLSADMLKVVADEAEKRGLSNLVTKQGTAEGLPCPSGSFDVLATRYSAHHWNDVPAGLTQMRRASKPGALAMFADVISPGTPLLDTWLQTLELLRDPSHVKNYSLSQWEDMLHQAGFVTEKTQTFRLRLEFSSWVARIKTPETHIQAIRALQELAPAEVREHFNIEKDGSFTIDTALIVARADS